MIGDEAGVKNELEELESSQELRAFPSRADALEFRKALTTYIAEQDLTVTALNTAQTTTTLDDVEYKAVNYTLAPLSNANALIGLLYLVDDVPSGVVQTLVLSRDPDSSSQWMMDLGVAVLYEG